MLTSTKLTTAQKLDILLLRTEKIESDVGNLKQDIGVQKVDGDNLKLGQLRLEKDMKVVKRILRQIRKDQNMIIDHFDKEDIKCGKRLDRLENHVGLAPIC